MDIVKKHGIGNDVELTELIFLQTKELLEAVSFNLDQGQRDEILGIAFDCIYKLGAIRYHHDRFLEEWGRRFDDVNKQENQAVIIEESILAYELEAYVFQIKSCLDALVKILRPIISQEIPTYKNYGDDIVKMLKNNLPDVLKLRSSRLIELISYHKDRWIKRIIDIRDELYHYIHHTHGLQNFFFLKTDKPGSLKAPHIDNRTDARLLVETSRKNICIFVIDFIAFSLYICLPPSFEIHKNRQHEIERWFLSLNVITGPQ